MSAIDNISSSSRKPLLTNLSYHTLWTGEGLPECDQQVIKTCRQRLLTRAGLGFLCAGGLMGGILFGRGLLNPQRRILLTTVFSVWGSAAAALTSTPACLRAVGEIKDSSSVLKKELSRIVVEHNPNIALQHSMQQSPSHSNSSSRP